LSKVNDFFNHSFTAFSSAFIGSLLAINLSGDPPIHSQGIEKEIMSPKPIVSFMENNPVLKKEFYSLENTVMNTFDKKKIPVLMFHMIDDSEKRYTVTPDNFRYILNRLHRNDYFALNLEQFSTGNFSEVPIGKKPFLITFDDASKGQFEYKSGKIDSDCAVGIMEEAFNKKKDFGKGAVFYESYFGVHEEYIEPFNGDMKKKNDFLIEHGYNIGSHTVIHNNNRSATIKDIKEQTINMDALLQYHTETDMVEQIQTYAHPYGAVPRNPIVRNYLEDQHDVIMLATGGMSSHPLSEKFDVKKVPRIEADMSTLYAFLNRKEQYVVNKIDKLYYEAKFKNKKPYFNTIMSSKPLAEIPSNKSFEKIKKINNVELPDSNNYAGNNYIYKGISNIDGK